MLRFLIIVGRDSVIPIAAAVAPVPGLKEQ